jgi:hypothetical protein
VLTNTDREIIVDISALKTNTDATIRFVNNEEYIVDIYGIDYAENLIFYNNLAPGASYIQKTYITYPWLVVVESTQAPIIDFASAVTPDPGFTGLSPDIANIGGVPEPSTWALTLLGTASLGLACNRRKKFAMSAV